MVDISVTPGSVTPVLGYSYLDGVAGETITAGQAIARDSTTKKFVKADSNAANAGLRTLIGIALHGASLDQPLRIQTAGDILIGATLAVGTLYVLSETPGGIQPAADLTTGEYVSFVGIGTVASPGRLKLGLLVSGVAVP